MEEEGIDAYFADIYYRKRDPRFVDAKEHKPVSKKKRFTKEAFEYQEEKDQYVCPAGKVLKREGRKAASGGFSGRHYKASAKDCGVCSLRSRCLRKETTKQRTLFLIEKRYGKNYCEAMKKKIDTPEGREMYSRRMGIVEPVFGNIRFAKGLDYITLRGEVKATLQWMLYCMVHNIEKICRYGFAYG